MTADPGATLTSVLSMWSSCFLLSRPLAGYFIRFPLLLLQLQYCCICCLLLGPVYTVNILCDSVNWSLMVIYRSHYIHLLLCSLNYTA